MKTLKIKNVEVMAEYAVGSIIQKIDRFFEPAPVVAEFSGMNNNTIPRSDTSFKDFDFSELTSKKYTITTSAITHELYRIFGQNPVGIEKRILDVALRSNYSLFYFVQKRNLVYFLKKLGDYCNVVTASGQFSEQSDSCVKSAKIKEFHYAEDLASELLLIATEEYNGYDAYMEIMSIRDNWDTYTEKKQVSLLRFYEGSNNFADDINEMVVRRCIRRLFKLIKIEYDQGKLRSRYSELEGIFATDSEEGMDIEDILFEMSAATQNQYEETYNTVCYNIALDQDFDEIRKLLKFEKKVSDTTIKLKQIEKQLAIHEEKRIGYIQALELSDDSHERSVLKYNLELHKLGMRRIQSRIVECIRELNNRSLLQLKEFSALQKKIDNGQDSDNSLRKQQYRIVEQIKQRSALVDHWSNIAAC